MILFQPIRIEDKKTYEKYLFDDTERGCGYSFTNLFLWEGQQAAVVENHLVLFSCLSCRSVYPYPAGKGDKRPVLDAIIADAGERNIPCCLTGLREEDMQELNRLYPDKFRIHPDRDSYDYVYEINALADLKGRKYHSKKNHLNRFRELYPDAVAEPLRDSNLPAVKSMIEAWYKNHPEEIKDNGLKKEQAALEKALCYYKELELETLVLRNNDKIVAVTLGSRVNQNTFDVHFEKAHPDIEGAYTAINYCFANYIRRKYPEVRFLNREEDMGIDGMRKAKLSYHPHHMIVRDRAILMEDEHEY